MLKRLRDVFVLIIATCASCLTAREEILKQNDINKIMGQILEQHLGKKEISSQILHNSLTTFINQFDPHRIYLLEEEVKPFVNLSANELSELSNDYKQNNFAIFIRLNDVIQSSIERSRRLRRGIEEEAKEALFQIKPKKDGAASKEKNNLFASTVAELKLHLFDHLEAFIHAQRLRYSDAIVAQRKEATIQDYEARLREFENQYLYVDDKGRPLPPKEKENLFTIHILKALASSLDAHTTFYQNNEAYDLRVLLQKEFQGIGIFLKDTKDGIVVTQLVEEGPAAKSGLIKVGDTLLEVEGKDIAEFPFDKVMEMLHDPSSPDVKLIFKRKGEEGRPATIYTVKLKRETIVMNNDRVDTSYENFGNGIIGKIVLHSFYQGDDLSSEKDVRQAILDLKSKGNLKGLILDLRDNSGGFLSQAVKVAGLFITNGVIVISKYSDGEERIYRDVDGKTLYDGPLIVLTSKTTASAAEIVAQALQDYGVALVVGDEQTYGKGTIQTQTITDNQSSSYFKVTVGKYYTVSGKTPQKEGVKADIVAPGKWNKESIGEEYLVGAVNSDKIAPSYEDNLKDISPDIKSWYLKYYIPKLQNRKTDWRDILPALKANSEYRIAHNKNYQFYLKGEKGVVEDDPADEDEEALGLAVKRQKDFGEDDLQMQEAINVVKDMILMQTLKATKK
jgi:carboxyl-terminal processing protease